MRRPAARPGRQARGSCSGTVVVDAAKRMSGRIWSFFLPVSYPRRPGSGGRQVCDAEAGPGERLEPVRGDWRLHLGERALHQAKVQLADQHPVIFRDLAERALPQAQRQPRPPLRPGGKLVSRRWRSVSRRPHPRRAAVWGWLLGEVASDRGRLRGGLTRLGYHARDEAGGTRAGGSAAARRPPPSTARYAMLGRLGAVLSFGARAAIPVDQRVQVEAGCIGRRPAFGDHLHAGRRGAGAAGRTHAPGRPSEGPASGRAVPAHRCRSLHQSTCRNYETWQRQLLGHAGGLRAAPGDRHECRPASRVERCGVIRCTAGVPPGQDCCARKGWWLALRQQSGIRTGLLCAGDGYLHRVAGDEPGRRGRAVRIPARRRIVAYVPLGSVIRVLVEFLADVGDPRRRRVLHFRRRVHGWQPPIWAATCIPQRRIAAIGEAGWPRVTYGNCCCDRPECQNRLGLSLRPRRPTIMAQQASKGADPPGAPW